MSTAIQIDFAGKDYVLRRRSCCGYCAEPIVYANDESYSAQAAHFIVTMGEDYFALALYVGDHCYLDGVDEFETLHEAIVEGEKEVLADWKLLADVLGYEVKG